VLCSAVGYSTVLHVQYTVQYSTIGLQHSTVLYCSPTRTVLYPTALHCNALYFILFFICFTV